jgi:hypothetical protein
VLLSHAIGPHGWTIVWTRGKLFRKGRDLKIQKLLNSLELLPHDCQRASQMSALTALGRIKCCIGHLGASLGAPHDGLHASGYIQGLQDSKDTLRQIYKSMQVASKKHTSNDCICLTNDWDVCVSRFRFPEYRDHHLLAWGFYGCECQIKDCERA